MVRAGVSVTWTVLSWSGGHEFEPLSGRTLGAWYFCPTSHLNQKCKLCGLDIHNRPYMTHHAVTRVKCVTRVITRDFFTFSENGPSFFIYFSVSGNPGHTCRICKLRAQKQCGVVSSKLWLERKNGLLKYYFYYLTDTNNLWERFALLVTLCLSIW